MKLLIASRNKDKVEEIKENLKGLNLQIVSALDFQDLPDVVEDKDTIKENAIKKALECASFTGLLTIADDTGFFVEQLGGIPGVYAARYAGENCSYSDNRKKMLKAMKRKSNRIAEFRTVVAFASPDGLIGISEGIVHGKVTEKEIGNLGFGYDPIFRADETGKTFGEMTKKEKHKISHRGKAIRKIIPILKRYVTQTSGL
ncbi:MAG: RdgB/HAM1 family non-canonical purine NTP pyrophosphatase [Armatimonadetes bacterium]|nr:RdgB/HAM1 family non-canonical purine NTP pyrophosphatase [Armatimonadota bacterium]